MGPGMLPGMYPQTSGYLNNFNSSWENLQNEFQLGQMEQQLGMLEQQQALQGMMGGGMAPGMPPVFPGMPGGMDQFGPMGPPQMGVPMPVGGTVPMGGINPISQMAGVPSPTQVLQQGGVTEGLRDVAGTGTPPWPKGTQETSGGYFVVPSSAEHAGQGAAAQGFTVYKPGSAGADKNDILFDNWGDPHVEDKNGKAIFSYSKDSDFQLPDGTTIAAKTSPYGSDGATVISGLDLVNGNSHVNMTYNSSTSNYDVGPDTNDGINWLANKYASSNWSHDTYNVALDSKGNPSFYDFVNGQDTGKVTGSAFQSGMGYVPDVDHNQTNYAVDKQFQPQPGSPGYGNMLWQQALQVFEDPKYRNNLPVGQLAEATSQWEDQLSKTQQGMVGPNAPIQQSPMYPGTQFGGAINPAMMQYLQYMEQMLTQYQPMQAGAYGQRY